MWLKNLSVRIAGPPLLLSVLLLALCLAAVFLYWQQVVTADQLTDDISSRQVAHDLENELGTLIALLHGGNNDVAAVHARVDDKLRQADVLADKPHERELVDQLEASFGRYITLWQKRHTVPPKDEDAKKQITSQLIAELEGTLLPACKELQNFNAKEIKNSERLHRHIVGWMVAGLAGIGTVGALTGVLLGYVVASRLRREVAHLSVRIQDAASKLSQDLPAVALTPSGDLDHLQRQMQGVVHEIEEVITRLQEREREVLRAEQLAAVGQLAAGVAHELRNPLTSIKMLVQTNREEATGGELPAEDLEVIEREIRRMERCLQHFLDFARPPRPQRRPLDLCVPVERTLALVAGRARKQQVAIQFQAPGEVLLAEADASQIQQLLINLTLNALDVMPSGGTLTIDLKRIDGQAELRVEDTGPGIAPELMPRLFSPFVSSKETGLGLGLVISQRIAEEHGGSLRAANRSEGGPLFVLRLPLIARGERPALSGRGLAG